MKITIQFGFVDADGAFNRIDVERILTEFDKYVMQSHFDAVWSSRVALAGRSIDRQTSRHLHRSGGLLLS